MARYYGRIGFAFTEETRPGVWAPTYVERYYKGDVVRSNRRYDYGQTVNGNLTLGNQISVIGDPYAYDHFYAMKYIEWMGHFWTITSVDIEHPRLLINIGEIYNGKQVDPGFGIENDSRIK